MEFFYLFVEKVHMKETKQMALQLDRKVHDSNTCPTNSILTVFTARCYAWRRGVVVSGVRQ